MLKLLFKSAVLNFPTKCLANQASLVPSSCKKLNSSVMPDEQ